MIAWLAAFLAVFIGGASVLLAAWAILLILDPAEEIHFEWAIPMLIVATFGALAAIALWIRGASSR